MASDSARARRDLPEHLPRIQARLAAHELPDVAIEAAELFLHSKKCLGILDGGRDLQPVADNAGIAQQLLHPCGARTRDDFAGSNPSNAAR